MAVSDEELLDAWSGGDSVAGGQLVDRHLGALQRFFGSKVASEADVEDLVGDALEGCVKARDTFRREAAFKTFLFRIAHFTLCKYLRRKRRRPEEHEIESEPVADLGPGPSTWMAEKAERRLLVEALRSLPLMYQVVLELKHFEGMSRTEIAEVLELPAGTVATRLRVGRARLDVALEELAVSPSLLRSTQTELQQWADGVRRGRA
jgi:RNA polymerase sigma-70 factor (ECF subfamily)